MSSKCRHRGNTIYIPPELLGIIFSFCTVGEQNMVMPVVSVHWLRASLGHGVTDALGLIRRMINASNYAVLACVSALIDFPGTPDDLEDMCICLLRKGWTDWEYMDLYIQRGIPLTPMKWCYIVNGHASSATWLVRPRTMLSPGMDHLILATLLGHSTVVDVLLEGDTAFKWEGTWNAWVLATMTHNHHVARVVEKRMTASRLARCKYSLACSDYGEVEDLLHHAGAPKAFRDLHMDYRGRMHTIYWSHPKGGYLSAEGPVLKFTPGNRDLVTADVYEGEAYLTFKRSWRLYHSDPSPGCMSAGDGRVGVKVPPGFGDRSMAFKRQWVRHIMQDIDQEMWSIAFRGSVSLPDGIRIGNEEVVNCLCVSLV